MAPKSVVPKSVTKNIWENFLHTEFQFYTYLSSIKFGLPGGSAGGARSLCTFSLNF